MPFLKTPALVLRRADFSETSQVLSLLTAQAGRVEVLAKGARRKGNAFDGPLDLATLVEAVILPRRPGTLSLLTEGKLLADFPGLRSSLPRFYAALYVVDLLREFVREGERPPGLFELAVETLYNAEKTEGLSLSPLLLAFTLRTLKGSGFNVETEVCAGCNRPLGDEERVGFSARLGGFACAACSPPRGGEGRLRGIARTLAAAAPAAAAKVRAPAFLIEGLWSLAGQSLAHALERPLRTLPFVTKTRKAESETPKKAPEG